MKKEIIIDGIRHVPEIKPEISKIKTVRTYSAGVFAGEVTEENGKEVTMKNARRLFYWSGAASLSQLTMEGVKNPDECKFPCPVNRVVLKEAIEVLDMTNEAWENICKVPIWEK